MNSNRIHKICPPSCPKRRLYHDFHASRFSPVSVLICGTQLERISTRRKFRILGITVICSGISPIFIKPMQAISISVLPGLVIGKRSKTNGKIRVRGRYGQPLCKIGRKRGDNIPLLRRHGFYRPVIQQNHEWHIHNRKKENADSFLHAGICCR